MDSVLSIRGLKTHFFLDEGIVRAVDGVDLEIPRGKTIGIVGESGCGKSVTAFSTLRLVSTPGRIVAGEIVLHREDGEVKLTDFEEEGAAIRAIRGKEIAMIFQEPMTSLSPVHTVGFQIVEALELHTDMRVDEARAHAIHMLERVGIPDATRRFSQYPHELSGGMRQRVMIAMALSCQPSVLIADEPTTALDVTIQAQILDMMQDLQEEFGMSIMLITHDLGVVAEMADEVAVMYLGRVVEHASTEEVFAHPKHPYTRALMESIPGLGGARKTRLQTIEGTVPDPFQRLSGCPFHPRCREKISGTCDLGDRPDFREVGREHQVACVLYPEGEGDE
ncbi:MAG: ABC transporter ATP-binding protein [bacterium]|nr:ABC transporter ATP-binding protein [bacterium]